MTSAPVIDTTGPPTFRWQIRNDIFLTLAGFSQLRYTLNVREHPDSGDAVTGAFNVPRTRLYLHGGVTKSVTFTMRLGLQSGGRAQFEQAYGDLSFGPVRIRAGQFFGPLVIEEDPEPRKLQAMDFSQVANVFGAGQIPGAGIFVDLDQVRLYGYYNNGLRSGFGEVSAPLNALYAFLGRVEARLRENVGGWTPFSDRSGFIGSDFAARIGVSGQYQRMSDTFALPGAHIAELALDATFEGSGWNVFGNGVWLGLDPRDATRLNAFGLFVQSGFFLAERWEVFGAFDAIYAPRKPFPDVLKDNPVTASGTGDYRSVIAGLNFYITPRDNLAKIQLDSVWGFDPVNPSLVRPVPNAGLFPTNTGGQTAVRLQLTVGF